MVNDHGLKDLALIARKYHVSHYAYSQGPSQGALINLLVDSALTWLERLFQVKGWKTVLRVSLACTDLVTMFYPESGISLLS